MKTKILRKLIHYYMVIIGIILLNGCSKTPNYTMHEKREMVINYLEEKYGEEFEGVSYASSEILKPYDEFWVYPKNGDKKNDLFMVTGVFSEDSKKYEMHDSYFGILIHDRYQSYVNELLNSIINNFYLLVNTKSFITYADRYNRNTEINEIYKRDEDKGLSSYMYIYIKQSSLKDEDEKNILMKIAEIMRENNLECRIKLYIVYDYKYNYFIDNFNNMHIREENWKEYYFFGEDKRAPYYEATVYENYDTKILEISPWEE